MPGGDGGGSTLGVRHLQVVLLFGSLVLVYCVRISMSVAIVPMSNSTGSNPDFPEYGWTNSERSLVLSSFFWSYVVTQLPGGVLAERTSAANLLVASTVFVSGVLALLTPLAAQIGGWQLVVVCRVLEGVVQGWLYPAVHCIIAAWVPLKERGLIVTVIYTGNYLGSVVGMSVSGLLAGSSAGWPSIFYLFGGLSTAWGVLFLLLGASSPDKSRLISQRERDYIQSTTEQKQEEADEDKQEHSIPRMAILKSPAVWALVIAQCGDSWGFWVLITEIPTYMASILKFDITQNGLLSALPYVVSVLVSFISGLISFQLQKRKVISLSASRKTFNAIGQFVAGLGLVGVALAPSSSPATVVTLLTVSVGVTGTMMVGYMPVHVDMSPRYAGTLMGLANGIANLLSIMGPLAVGAIVTNDTYQEWQTVFFISTAVYFLCGTIFIIFGSAEEQPWNDANYKNKIETGSLQQPKTVELTEMSSVS